MSETKYDVVSLGRNDSVRRSSYTDIREARETLDILRQCSSVIFLYMEEVSDGERHVRTTWMSVL